MTERQDRRRTGRSCISADKSRWMEEEEGGGSKETCNGRDIWTGVGYPSEVIPLSTSGSPAADRSGNSSSLTLMDNWQGGLGWCYLYYTAQFRHIHPDSKPCLDSSPSHK